VDGNQATVGPVTDVEGLLISGRKSCSRTEGDSGGATDSDGCGLRQTIGVVLWPFGGAFAKAIIATLNGMEDVNRSLPGGAPVPFHVAVPAEQLTVGIEGDVVGVTLA